MKSLQKNFSTRVIKFPIKYDETKHIIIQNMFIHIYTKSTCITKYKKDSDRVSVYFTRYFDHRIYVIDVFEVCYSVLSILNNSGLEYVPKWQCSMQHTDQTKRSNQGSRRREEANEPDALGTMLYRLRDLPRFTLTFLPAFLRESLEVCDINSFILTGWTVLPRGESPRAMISGILTARQRYTEKLRAVSRRIKRVTSLCNRHST